MTKLTFVALFVLLAAGTATAGETGVINQAGPYETTMQFYLHPAHGFPGAAPQRDGASAPEAAAVSAATEATEGKEPAKKVASRARHPIGLKTRYTTEYRESATKGM